MTSSAADVPSIMQATKQSDRAIYTYTLPPRLAGLGVSTVGLVELRSHEEIMAAKRTGGDMTMLAFELAKESLRRIDGRAVNTGDGSADRAWQTLHPKVRQLVMHAYGSLHTPEAEDSAAFMESCQASV